MRGSDKARQHRNATIAARFRQRVVAPSAGTKPHHQLYRIRQPEVPMPSMQGTVTIVQESRFQLTDPDGVSHNFLLSWKAPAEPQQLAALQQEQARVQVKYTSAHNIIGLLATDITRLDV
jgi:hypothetical protein